MKRILCAVTALTLFITLLTACGGPKTALHIGGAQVSSEIYTYYYDLVKRSPEQYPGDARENTISLCKEYVAVNTLAAERSITLKTEREAAASAWVNQQWKFFSTYYTGLGISKQTLMKVRENEARRELLLEAYYGANGLQPVAEDALKDYFSKHFVVFKSINGYLTDTNDAGESVALSDDRIEEIKKQFNTMADSISKGTSIEEANTKYLESQNSTSVGEFTASVINGGNTDYPEVLRSGCGDEKWRREGDHAFHLHLCGAEAGCFGREGQLFHAIPHRCASKHEGGRLPKAFARAERLL